MTCANVHEFEMIAPCFNLHVGRMSIRHVDHAKRRVTAAGQDAIVGNHAKSVRSGDAVALGFQIISMHANSGSININVV
jgi:hypothetical protein